MLIKKIEKLQFFLKKKTYDLIGWSVSYQILNFINFSIKIKNVNSKINPKIFKIPSIN